MRKLMSVVMVAFVLALSGTTAVFAATDGGSVCLASSGLRIN
jgi:hypothetical protein